MLSKCISRQQKWQTLALYYSTRARSGPNTTRRIGRRWKHHASSSTTSEGGLLPPMKQQQQEKEANDFSLLPSPLETESKPPPSSQRYDIAKTPSESDLTLNQHKQKSQGPKYMLHAWYREHFVDKHVLPIYKHCVFYGKHQPWYSTTISCPITNTTLHCGTLRDFSRGKVSTFDGLVHYSKGKRNNRGGNASQAAAARLLDCILYTTQNQQTEPRLCVEEPIVLPGLLTKILNENDKLDSTPKTEEVGFSPKQELCRQYDLLVRCFFSRQMASTGMTTGGTPGMWTATFTCPMTGHAVTSGKWKQQHDYRVVKDGIVTYTSKNLAQHAAAARFLDDLHFSLSGQVEPRLCHETPNRLPIEILTAAQSNEYYFNDDPVNLLTREYWILDGRRQREVKKQLSTQKVGEWYTSTFTCPITGHVERSGTLDDGVAGVVDGVVYYKEKWQAEHAAAARFRDQLTFSLGRNQQAPICKETPTQVKALEELKGMKYRSGNGKSPRMILKEILRISSPKLVTETNTLGKDKYTSVVTCPVSGHVALSGTLQKSRDAETTIDNKVVVYTSVAGAELAAAGRYLDDLRYTQTGESEPRWCKEFPTRIEGSIDAIGPFFLDDKSASKYVAILTKETGKTSSATDSTADDDDEELVLVQPTQSNFVVDAEATDSPQENEVQWNSEPEDDDEEELVLRNVTPFASSGTSTLDRIMQVWGETVTTGTDASLGGAVRIAPTRQKEKVIADTEAWHTRLARQASSTERGFRVFQTLPMTIKSTTAALGALAKAHWNEPSQSPKNDKRVEAAAQQMIDLMWTTDSPTIEGYNSYLRCLARSSPTETGQAAQDLLRAMIEQTKVDGRLLPEPNIETFNTVIQLWALVGGDAGYSKCQEVFDLIEKAQSQGMDVRPNRDTFLSVLASLARPQSAQDASYFNRERAQQWIERTRSQGDDDSFTADTQVFNAPLRWSGGDSASRARPFCQALPWDRHENLIENGFRPLQENDPLWVEALQIQEWLDAMLTSGPEPDVETYEAAIQAWARTGMAKGLENAESVALQALESDSNNLPRLQTFHPIFCAWACSGDERALDKIDEWANRLTPEISLDDRIDLAKMIARRTMQERLLEDNVQDESIDKAVQIAESCEGTLQKLVGLSKEDDDTLFDPSVFSHAVSAWGDVALARISAAASPDTEAMNANVDSMLGIIKQFDDTIQHFRHQVATMESTDMTAPHWDLQLKLLLQYSQTLYLNAVSILNKLDQEDDSSSAYFERHLFAVESMLRRSQELRLVLQSQTDISPNDIEIQYKDQFTYPSLSNTDLDFFETQIALYSQIVAGCKQCMTSENALGDSLRLVMLIVDLLYQSDTASHETTVDCTNLFFDIITVVQEGIPSEQHQQHECLRRIFHCVNRVSDKHDCVDRNAVLSKIKIQDGLMPIEKKKPNRPKRRVKRQKWRSASKKWKH